MIWDYVDTYANYIQPQPDILVNVANLRMFKESGVVGIYPQGSAVLASNGMPFKAWLLARCMWNPDGLDGENLLKQFCLEYYGQRAGGYINQYWTMLRKVNRAAGYYKINQAGWQGKAPHASLETMLKADELFRKALKAVSDNPVYLKHVQFAYLPVQYMFLNYWKLWRSEAVKRNMKMPHALDSYYEPAVKVADEYGLYYNERTYPPLGVFFKKLKSIAMLNFTASASNCYGACNAYSAFDGDLKTRTSYGGYSGWSEIEFPEAGSIKRVTTFLGKNRNVSCDYEIKGSLDGRKWFVLVSRREVTKNFNPKIWLKADDEITPPKRVKFVKTFIHGIKYGSGGKSKPNWTGIDEQKFDFENSAH
jgi:hypothetical protein